MPQAIAEPEVVEHETSKAEPNPATDLASIQEAYKPGEMKDEFDEIDQIATQKKPTPRRSVLKDEAKPEAPKTKAVATGKPQSEPPDKPVEEAEPIDLRKMKLTAPEDLVDEFMSPNEPEESKETKDEPETAKDEPEEVKEEVAEEDAEKPNQEPLRGNAAKQLRTAYEDSKKRVQLLESEVQKLKESPREDPEKAELSKKLEATATRLNELQDELRYANYQRSPEYKEKFFAPIQKAYEAAYEDIGAIELPERVNDVGDVVESSRTATNEDFNVMLQMPLNAAIKYAREKFGDASAEILHHRRKIIELSQAAKGAIDEFKTKGAERESESKQASEKKAVELKRIWDETTRDISDKFPAYFKPVNGDDESNTLLEKGYQVTDYALSNPNVAPEKIVRLHAMMRHKAASFDAVVSRFRRDVKTKEDRIKELEAELKDYQKSEPGEGDKRGSKAPVDTGNDWEAEIDSMARSK